MSDYTPLPGEDPDYGLMMRIAVTDAGGSPYEDVSWSAGYEMGALNGVLSHHPREYRAIIRTDNVPQADLIAMKYGYRFSQEVTIVATRTLVSFERSGEAQEPTP